MYTVKPEQINNELEAFIDTYGINRLLEGLYTICLVKAEHIRTNWQDEALAKIWDNEATFFKKAFDSHHR